MDPKDESEEQQPPPHEEDELAVKQSEYGTMGLEDKEEKEETAKPSFCRRNCKRIVDFYWTYQFPLHILLAIGLAKAYPPLGAEYLHPEITATWIAVMIIFLLAGLGLKTSDFSKTAFRLRFNSFVQVFNFGFVSSSVYAVSRFLVFCDMLDQTLADGMVICACLPMAINVVIVLTASAEGDEAAAIFNATFGNIVGIFLSPLLILGYLGTTGEIDLGQVFLKLTIRVVVPLIVGQALQKIVPTIRDFYSKHKRAFKKAQESCLVYIVYTVFCRTFSSDVSAGIDQVLLMTLYLFLLLVMFMEIAWYSLRFLFRDEPELRVMGLFGCVQKTVALGVPLIGSIYEDDPNVGLYTLPILIYHPMQLVLGSLLVPRLGRFVTREREKLDDRVDGKKVAADDVEAQESFEDAVSETEDDNTQEKA